MQDGSFQAERRRGGKSGAVASFAADVVARVAARHETRREILKEHVVQRLLDAVRAPDLEAFRALGPDLRRARISPARLADHYIPEVARRLGVEWEKDTLSFADVTIGTARLQAMLREIGADWTADDADRDGLSTVLLILPDSEQHTLGAMVVAGSLRRRGISVCLRIAPKHDELCDLLAARRCDAVMISVAIADRLDSCAALIATIRQHSGPALPIAVGGAILGVAQDVKTATGADIATNDLAVALETLGLTQRRRL